jgi:hypothetical protein
MAVAVLQSILFRTGSAMRLVPFSTFAAAMLAALVAVPASAEMYKCTTRDGTVLYQSKPCGAGDREATITNGQVADGASAKPATREAAERAVFDRDVAQRRARCGVYRENVERFKALLDSPNEVTRSHAGNDIKEQERRMREDNCAAL